MGVVAETTIAARGGRRFDNRREISPRRDRSERGKFSLRSERGWSRREDGWIDWRCRADGRLNLVQHIWTGLARVL